MSDRCEILKKKYYNFLSIFVYDLLVLNLFIIIIPKNESKPIKECVNVKGKK